MTSVASRVQGWQGRTGPGGAGANLRPAPRAPKRNLRPAPRAPVPVRTGPHPGHDARRRVTPPLACPYLTAGLGIVCGCNPLER